MAGKLPRYFRREQQFNSGVMGKEVNENLGINHHQMSSRYIRTNAPQLAFRSRQTEVPAAAAATGGSTGYLGGKDMC